MRVCIIYSNGIASVDSMFMVILIDEWAWPSNSYQHELCKTSNSAEKNIRLQAIFFFIAIVIFLLFDSNEATKFNPNYDPKQISDAYAE